MDKISVIIPIYNAEKYVARCIESIRNQTYKNLEIILVDDGSEDSSGQICELYSKYDDRIIVIHKENNGAGSARNIGLSKATGEYIGFVDSDDYIKNDMYAYLYNLIYNYGADLAIVGLAKVMNGIKRKQQVKENIQIVDKHALLIKFFRVYKDELFISPCVRLYKRSILKDVVFMEGVINEDVEFSYKVFSKTNKVVMSNLPKYFWFYENTSVTRNCLKKRDFDLLKMWDLVVENTKLNNPQYIEYASINRLRAEFTLLCKGALYGIDKSVEDTDIINDMLMNIRKNIFSFLKYKGMSLNRKIILVIMYIDYGLLKFISNKYGKWMEK